MASRKTTKKPRKTPARTKPRPAARASARSSTSSGKRAAAGAAAKLGGRARARATSTSTKAAPASRGRTQAPRAAKAKAKTSTRAARAVTAHGMPPIAAPADRRQRRRPVEVIRRVSDMQARMMSARARGLTVGFVPTMGALHAGHAALLDEARRRADIVVASVFVNPKQFAPNEDYTRYPRTLDADTRLCEGCGVDFIFAPDAAEIYPDSFDTSVKAGALAADLEGKARYGHFDGVLTIVLTLFSIVQPHFAVFGEKDFQQLALIRRMVRDFRLTVEVVAMPVIRDVDGLALSSRNAYLAPPHRAQAVALYRALMAAQDEAQRGVVDTARFAQAARAALAQAEGVEVDYVEVRDARTLEPVAQLDREARLLIAARLGGVRLIDNGPLFPGVRYP